jgi:hemerythrin-like domain-containing protein
VPAADPAKLAAGRASPCTESIEGIDMTPSQSKALDIIRGEHRTLNAVIDALRHVADEVAAGTLVADYRLLWSIVYYIDEFPDRLHHPKEDDVLFPRVRARTRDIDAALDDLARQHDNGRVHLAGMKTLLGRMEAEIPGAVREFADKVATYASFHRRHVMQEETIVLPKASEVLTDEDWNAIAAAFGENRDPLLDGKDRDTEWFRRFYTRIVTLVPEPWGVGARHAP